MNSDSLEKIPMTYFEHNDNEYDYEKAERNDDEYDYEKAENNDNEYDYEKADRDYRQTI